MAGGPWNNVQLAPPPQAPSYAAPQVGLALGQLLGNLPQDFQQAQQYARQRALQTMFADPSSAASQALQRAGVDPNSLYGQLAKVGGAETALPLAQRMQQGALYQSIMGGSGGGGDIYSAILGQESGNRDNVGDSSAGAIGPAQIMPATFNQYAQRGEDIRDPATNRAVGKRIVDDYQQRYNGDPARIATAYYSGPGNVAPPGAPTPWIKDIRPKGGPSVSQYVGQVIGRMPVGQQPASAQSVDQGGASTTQADIGQMAPERMSPEFADRLESGADQLRKSAGALGASGFPAESAKAQLDRADKLSAQAAEIRKFLSERQQQQFGVGIKGQEAAVSEAGKSAGKRVGEVIESGGQAARQQLNILGEMQAALDSAGGNLSTGPGAEAMLKIKQTAGNWLGIDFKGLSQGETIQKLNAQLAAASAKAMTARPSQLEFKTFVANNPGLQNSIQGTRALINILSQTAQQNIALGQLASRVQDPRSWPAIEDRFYQQNPIKSPFTGQPLSGDERAVGRAPQPQAGPPPGALQYLRQNPATRAQFDAKYGPGAAAQALGEGT